MIEVLAIAVPDWLIARTVNPVPVRADTTRLTGMLPPPSGLTPEATTARAACRPCSPAWSTVANPLASVVTATVRASSLAVRVEDAW